MKRIREIRAEMSIKIQQFKLKCKENIEFVN